MSQKDCPADSTTCCRALLTAELGVDYDIMYKRHVRTVSFEGSKKTLLCESMSPYTFIILIQHNASVQIHKR